MNKQIKELELFITKKYNSGEMTAKEYSQINILLGEFEKAKSQQENCGDTPTQQQLPEVTNEEGKVSTLRNGDTADNIKQNSK